MIVKNSMLPMFAYTILLQDTNSNSFMNQKENIPKEIKSIVTNGKLLFLIPLVVQ